MDLKEKKIKNILVRGTNWVGDALMTTPALAAVGDNFPRARIMVLAKKWVAPVYAAHPAVSDVHVFDDQGRHRGISGLMRLAGELKKERFDLAVLFQNAFQAALIAFLAGIPHRLGFAVDGRGFLLKPSIGLRAGDKQVHETEYYLRLLQRAGLEIPGSEPNPVFYLTAKDEEQAQKRLAGLGIDSGFILGLAPGAAYGPAKQWPPEKYAAAANIILREKQGAALIFGSKGEAQTAKKTAEHINYPCFDLSGQTGLSEAAALLKRCHLVLSNDSGLMHVAAAVDAPLVAVFGSTNPVTTSPRGRNFCLIRHQVDCAPCLKPTCTQPTHKCMDLVASGEVAEAGLALLSGAG